MKTKFVHAMVMAALGASTLGAAATASAEDLPITANVSMSTDYLFRGVTQTNNNPAVQGGFDYEHESGFYAGVWGSNVAFAGSVELDGYFGYANELPSGFAYDVGFIHYNYPGEGNANPEGDTDEIYLGGSYKWFSASYSYALSNLFGVADSDGSGYLALGAEYTFEGPAVTVGAHYGMSDIENGNDYDDYNISVSKSFGSFDVSAMYSDTDVNGADHDELVLSVSRSF